MEDAFLAIMLGILQYNADLKLLQHVIVRKIKLCVLTATNLVILQDSVEAGIMEKEVW